MVSICILASIVSMFKYERHCNTPSEKKALGATKPGVSKVGSLGVADLKLLTEIVNFEFTRDTNHISVWY